MSTTVDIGTLIVRTPGTLAGRPRIDGTRIGVNTIVLEIEAGASPEQLVSEDYWPYLTLAQVYAALAFYHANKAEIDDFIAEENRLYVEMAAEARRNGQGTTPGR